MWLTNEGMEYAKFKSNDHEKDRGLPTWTLLIMATMLVTTNALADEVVQLNKNLKGYVKVGGVSGNLNSIGSDTLNNLMTLWAEGLQAVSECQSPN